MLPLEGLPFNKWYVHGYASSAHEVHYGFYIGGGTVILISLPPRMRFWSFPQGRTLQ